jgi:hypothetical protein
MRPEGLTETDRVRLVLAVDRFSSLNALDDLWTQAIELEELSLEDLSGVRRAAATMVRHLDRLPYSCRDTVTILDQHTEALDARLVSATESGGVQGLQRLFVGSGPVALTRAAVVRLADRAIEAAFEIHEQRPTLADNGPSTGLPREMKHSLLLAIGALRVFAGLPLAEAGLSASLAGISAAWVESLADAAAATNGSGPESALEPTNAA